jgi:uncharacterized protein YdaU (DUF1376 family)
MSDVEEKTLIIKDSSFKKGFTSVPNVILTSSLSFGAKTIYSLLLMFAWQEKETFPGQARLAQAAGCTERTVRTYLNELKKEGLITWKQRGLTKTNVYYINSLDSFSDRKDSSGQDRKQSDKKNTSGSDRKSTSAHDRKHTSDKEYTDQKDTDQKDTVRVSNDSFHSSLDTRGPQKLNQKPEPGTDTQNINIEPPEATMKDGLTSAGVNNKKPPVEREFDLSQDVLSLEEGFSSKSSPVEMGINLNQGTLPIEPGVCYKSVPVEKEHGINQDGSITGTGVNIKKSPVEREPDLNQKTLSEAEALNNMPVEKEPTPNQEQLPIETGVNNKTSDEKGPDLNQETPLAEECVSTQITNADLITILGDSLREAWDGPPAKAYAIAGRMYYLYDYPAAEASINIFRSRVEEGSKLKNPVAYLMKVAREKKKEFESVNDEPQPEEDLDYFSVKYPEEHLKRVEDAKKVSAEHEQYLRDLSVFDDRSPPSVPGFSTPGEKIQLKEDINASSD